MTRILVLDNYDSFVYTLDGYLQQLGAETTVLRNDAFAADAAGERIREYDGVLLSPGPGKPSDAGVSIPVVRAAAKEGVPLLGVCLGHQAIGQAYGGNVVRAPRVMHGKVSAVWHDGSGLFAGLPNPFEATRYHSLVVERASLPDALEVTAWTEDGLVMGVRHRTHPVVGVQFHPESICTPVGHRLLAAFLDGAGVPRVDAEAVA
jgi:para-aminobenzoate synthetase component II